MLYVKVFQKPDQDTYSSSMRGDGSQEKYLKIRCRQKLRSERLFHWVLLIITTYTFSLQVLESIVDYLESITNAFLIHEIWEILCS